MEDVNATKMKSLSRPEVFHEVELDEGHVVKFRILKWKPTKVFENIPRIGKIFAVPFSMVATASGNSGETLSSLLPVALIQLFNTLDEEGITEFFKMILADVYVNGVSVANDFDSTFMNNPELVIELVAKVIEVHYAPFFKKGFGSLLSSMNLVTKMDQLS